MGAKRLRLAVLMTTTLSVLGSVIGLLLAFYLTFIGAWSSLTSAQMTIFLLAWTVPTLPHLRLGGAVLSSKRPLNGIGGTKGKRIKRRQAATVSTPCEKRSVPTG